MNRIFKIIAVSILLLGISVSGFAATPAGTLIRTTTLNIEYTADGALVSRNFTDELITTVDAIYGIEVYPEITVTATLDFNETFYFAQEISNRANTADAIQFSLDDLTAGWSALVYYDDNADGVHQVGETTVAVSPISIAQETTRSVFVALTSPASYITPAKVIFHPQTLGSSAGAYIGYNGIAYGGYQEVLVTENAELIGIPPEIFPVLPTADALDVPVNTDIVFDVTDDYAVATESIRVTIDGELAILNGIPVDPATYNINFTDIGSGYQVSINIGPDLNWGSIVTLNIYAEDNDNIAAELSYKLTTMFDTIPPTINSVSPNATTFNQTIWITVADAESGVATQSILIDGVDYTADFIVEDVSAAPQVLPLAFTPGQIFEYGKTLTITVNAEDFFGNTMDPYTYSVIVGMPPTMGIVSPVVFSDNISVNTTFVFVVEDADSEVDKHSIDMIVNGVSVWEDLVILPTGSYEVRYNPPLSYEYESTINVTINASDVDGRVMPTYVYYLHTDETPTTDVYLNLTVLLQGYYDPATGLQRPATVNVQLRTTQDISDGPGVVAPLDASGNTGLIPLPVFGADPGIYYIAIWQSLAGEKIGSNHLVYVSSENISFVSGTTIVDLTDAASPHFREPFIPRSGHSPLFDEGSNIRSIKGGDASAEQKVSLMDIVWWNEAATSANANQRSRYGFRENVNFNGDDYINTDDFAVWKKNKGQEVPLPEKDKD